MQELANKIKSKKAKVGLIGVGYVGSALGIGAASMGYEVVGYARHKSSTDKVKSLGIKNFTATNDINDLKSCDIICICVPTPVFEDKTPDTSPLENALEKTASIIRKNMLVVIESSIAPGMTRSIALPAFRESNLKLEKDFFLSFSPERIDPGNKDFDFNYIPKVVSGYGDNSLKLATAFYREVVSEVHPVSSFEVAEMSKILENTFRLVNISLINQISNYTETIGIDIWEVIEAAKTKPFGFMPHYPGSGIGGHCIPVDPHYLLEDAKNHGINLSIVSESGVVNDRQPERVVGRTKEILRRFSNGVRKDKVLLIGVSYKKNISDTRESPAGKIWNLLEQEGMRVSYHDPYVDEFKNRRSLPLNMETLSENDVAVIVTSHDVIDFGILLDSDIPVLDTQNVLNENGKIALPHTSVDMSQQVFKLFNQIPILQQ